MVTLPHRRRPSFRICPTSLLLRIHSTGMAHEIPHQDQGVVGAAREQSPVAWTPLDAVHGGAVALELQQSLTRLPDIKDTDDFRILGEGCEEVCVMGRSCYSEEWWWK